MRRRACSGPSVPGRGICSQSGGKGKPSLSREQHGERGDLGKLIGQLSRAWVERLNIRKQIGVRFVDRSK